MTSENPATSIRDLSARILANERPSAEELRAALDQLRADRGFTGEKRAKKNATKPEVALPTDLGDLFK